MPQIVLVPTSHVSPASIRAIEQAVAREKPECIAVELDAIRYAAMQQKQRPSRGAVRSLGPTTFLMLWLFKWLQSWLGRKTGILPGEEMLSAVRLAEKQQIPYAFIDQDIRITFLGIKAVPRREKLKLVWFLMKGFSPFSKKQKIDLRNVPPKTMIREAMGVFQREFPGLYQALVHERDIAMSHALLNLTKEYRTIVAVVGAGHEAGVTAHINQHQQ